MKKSNNYYSNKNTDFTNNINNINKSLIIKPLKRLYIEKKAQKYNETNEIINRVKPEKIIEINHYKDIFNTPKQNFNLQKKSPALILSVKEDGFLYKGSPLCHNFGFTEFYYTTHMFNCLYNCHYCFLKGMYPSGHINLFVNKEDCFNQIQDLAVTNRSIFLAPSYETDIIALNHIMPLASFYSNIANLNSNITIELRTKSANKLFINELNCSDNLILAFTLSPQYVITNYEENTPSLKARLDCINFAINKGFKVRLCFDPLLYVEDFEKHYYSLIKTVFDNIKPKQVFDYTIGVFRMPSDYLKNARKKDLYSPFLHYPFETVNNVSSYPKTIINKMTGFVLETLKNYVSDISSISSF